MNILKDFDEKEIKELTISIIGLTFLFSMSSFLAGQNVLSRLIISFFGVGIGFILHGLAHKYTAEHYDLKARYEMDFNLFLLSLLITGITGGEIILAAPGAVVIKSSFYTRIGHKFSKITRRERGIISLSGSLANISLALVCLILAPLNMSFFKQVMNINLLLAFFNMLPFPPLDGSSVFYWNRMTWFAAIIIPLFLMFFSFNWLFSLIGTIILIVFIIFFWEKLF